MRTPAFLLALVVSAGLGACGAHKEQPDQSLPVYKRFVGAMVPCDAAASRTAVIARRIKLRSAAKSEGVAAAEEQGRSCSIAADAYEQLASTKLGSEDATRSIVEASQRCSAAATTRSSAAGSLRLALEDGPDPTMADDAKAAAQTVVDTTRRCHEALYLLGNTLGVDARYLVGPA